MKKIYICPHFHLIKDKYFDQIFTRASSIRGVEEDLFFFTHYPIFLYDQDEFREDITQNDVLQELLKDRFGNFTVSIEGEAGTGKSELCVYLKYELERNGMKVLALEKSADLMSMLADDIPNFYKEITKARNGTEEKIKGYDNLQNLQLILKKNRGILATNIATRVFLDLAVTYTDQINVSMDDPKVRNFIEFLERQMMQLINRDETQWSTELDFISINDYRSKYNDFDFNIPGDEINVCEILNKAIWDAIRTEKSIPTLDTLIKEIDAILNERWTIIFEDFSITSLDQQKLQNFMEQDSTKNKVNFIIAGLSDKLQGLRTKTAIGRLGERIRFYKTCKTGETSVLFLDEDNCVEFIRPYICFLKQKEGSLDYERDENSKIKSLKLMKGENLCNKCNKCSVETRDIFPFSEIFLKRIYQGLEPENQIPRIYVATVGSILGEYYRHGIPPSSATLLVPLSSLILPDSILDLNDEKIGNYIRWYGIEEEDKFLLSKTYADLLGIDYPSIKNFKIKDDIIEIFKLEGEIEAEGSESKSRGRKVEEEETTPEWLVEYYKYKGYIPSWRREPHQDKWSQVLVYFIEIINEIFNKLTEKYKISYDSPINIRIGKDEQIFVFNKMNYKQGLEPFQISINSQDFTEKNLKFLLQRAIYRNKRRDAYDLGEILKITPYPIIESFKNWQKKCKEYIYNFQFFKKEVSHYRRFIDLAFLNCVISFIVQNPWIDFIKDKDNLFGKFRAYLNDTTLDNEIPDHLLNKLKTNKILREKLSQFLNISSFSKNLCKNYIKVINSTVLDLELLGDYIRKTMDFIGIIKQIKSRGTMKLFYNIETVYKPNRVKLNAKEGTIELKDYFEIIYTFGTQLDEKSLFFDIDSERILNDVNFIDSSLRNLNFKSLMEIIKELKVFPSGTVNRNLLISLNDLLRKERAVKEILDSIEYLKKILKGKSSYSEPYYDSNYKFQIVIAYSKFLNYEGIFKLVNKIDNLIQVKKSESLDITKIINMRDYIE